jgi:LTXXQ motif family protein
MKTSIIATALAAAAMSASAWAQAPDPHHPAERGAPPVVTQPVAPTPPGMMGGMAEMMRMMQSTRMMGPGMMGMGTIDRVEGRIAFLRAELKITDAQANVWNTFANALRTNAQKLGAIRPAIMHQPGSSAPQTLQERLDVQERWLAARLEGTRAIKAAFTPLVGTFSEDQKKTATELLGAHLGLAMMPGQMGPGQMMGPR